MNDVRYASTTWEPGDAPGAPAAPPAVDLQDAADFRQWLHARPGAAADAPAPPGIGQLLGSVQHALHAHEQQLDKTVRRVGRSGDPVASLQLQQHLSDAYLTHGLAVKVISKTTQALDSLVKLQ